MERTLVKKLSIESSKFTAHHSADGADTATGQMPRIRAGSLNRH